MERPYYGLTRGNLGLVVGGIGAGLISHAPVVTTLLATGTIAFFAMLLEPPLFAWMERRQRAKVVHHFIVIPDANCAYQRVNPHRVAKPANSSAAHKTEEKPTEGK